jgi:hypothetical protein
VASHTPDIEELQGSWQFGQQPGETVAAQVDEAKVL